MDSTTINSFGLLLDIAGVILIYKYGLPERLHPKGVINIIAEQENEEEKEKYKIYKRWSALGIWLLIIGFALQVLSNYL